MRSEIVEGVEENGRSKEEKCNEGEEVVVVSAGFQAK